MPSDMPGGDHAVETYKSLIQISVEGFKLAALVNGGAAVALLAYLGNVAGKAPSTPDMRIPMGFFLLGLLLDGLAMVGGYLTQLALFNDTQGRADVALRVPHSTWLVVAICLLVGSLGSFGIGAYCAVIRF